MHLSLFSICKKERALFILLNVYCVKNNSLAVKPAINIQPADDIWDPMVHDRRDGSKRVDRALGPL